MSRNRLRLSRGWLLVLALTVGCVGFCNLLAPCLFSGFVAAYVAQPIAWMLLFVYVYRRFPRPGLGKRSLRLKLIKIATGLALCQIYLMVVAGLLDKFGKSPNSFKPSGIVINLIFVASGLLAVEFSRNYLIVNSLRRPSNSVAILAAVFFTGLLLPWKQFPALDSGLETFAQFAGSTLLPVFAENLLASFLCMWGGAWPAIAYRGTLAAFNWFCPVLPNLNWALKTLTGTLVPTVGAVFVYEYCSMNMKGIPGRQKKIKPGQAVNWAITSALAVILVWFAIGVFPIRPLVIYSGSMRPTIDVGDVVIVAKRNPRLLHAGEVIAFRVPDSPVPTVHRILAARTEGSDRLFTTKGDANANPDSGQALGDNVIGKVVLVIPKAGWASIALRELFV